MDTILKVLESSISKTNSSKSSTSADVEKNFNSLINSLKESVENDELMPFLKNASNVSSFIKVFQYYISSCNNQQGSDKLAILSLRSLGYFLFSQSVVSLLLDNQIRDISTLLENTIQITKKKNVCNYAIWCLSSQSFPKGPITSKLVQTYCNILETTPFASKTIEHEILASFIKINTQNPDLFSSSRHIWIPTLLNKLLNSSLSKDDKIEFACNEKVESILKSLISSTSTINQDEQLRKVLVDKYTDAIEKMNKMYESDNEIFAIRVWGYYIYFLGEGIFTNAAIVNAFLKLPEKSFVNQNEEIRIETFQSWRYLIDSIQHESLMNSKRLLLITRPIIAGFKQDVVLDSCFSTWLYLLSIIGQQSNTINLFPYVFTPILPLVLENSNFSKYCFTLICVLLLSENSKYNSILKNEFKITLKPIPELNGQWLLQNGKIFIQVLQYFEKGTTTNEGSKMSESIPIDHNSMDMLQPCFMRDRIEIWNALMERIATIDTKDSSYIPLIQMILKSMESISNSSIECAIAEPENSDFIIHFLKSLHNITVQLLPKSILYSVDYKTNLKNYDTPLIPYDFILVNLIEIGLNNKLETNGSLLPMVNEIIQYSCSNSPDLILKINTILEVINPVLSKNSLSLSNLNFVLQIWVQNATIIQNFIDRSNQISSNSIGNNKSINIRSILIWPLTVLTTYDNSESVSVVDSLVQTWKSLLQSYHRYHSVRTSSNPLVDQLVNSIYDSTTWNSESNLEINIGVLSVLVSLIDPNSSNSSSSKKKNDMESFLINIFSFVNKIIQLVDDSKNFIKYLPTILTPLTLFVKKLPSVSLLITYLNEMTSSYHCILKCLQSESLGGTSQQSQQKEQIASFKKICNQSWHTLLDTTARVVGDTYEHGDQVLSLMSELLNVAFLSKQSVITEKTLEFWNSVFGERKQLNYSSTLWSTLNAVSRKVDIQIPPRESDTLNGKSGNNNNHIDKHQATLGSFNGSLQLAPEINMIPNGDFQFDREHILNKKNKKNNNSNSNNSNSMIVEQPLKRKRVEQQAEEEPEPVDDSATIAILDSPAPRKYSNNSDNDDSSGRSTPNALPMAILDEKASIGVNDIKSQLTNITLVNLDNFSNSALLEIQGLALLIANEINGTIHKRLSSNNNTKQSNNNN